VDQVADLRMMLNDFGVFATLTDASASSSSTVKGIFDNGTVNLSRLVTLMLKQRHGG